MSLSYPSAHADRCCLMPISFLPRYAMFVSIVMISTTQCFCMVSSLLVPSYAEAVAAAPSRTPSPDIHGSLAMSRSSSTSSTSSASSARSRSLRCSRQSPPKMDLNGGCICRASKAQLLEQCWRTDSPPSYGLSASYLAFGSNDEDDPGFYFASKLKQEYHPLAHALSVSS